MSNNSRPLLHDKRLQRFGFTFNEASTSPLKMSYGITAYDRSDALEILQKNVFSKHNALVIESITNDIDIQTMDQNHIIPNMGLVTNRGVWFPLGF